MDQNIIAYRIEIRGKNGRGVCCHGWWMVEYKTPRLLFATREVIWTNWIKKKRLPCHISFDLNHSKKTAGRKSFSDPGVSDISFDNTDHFVEPVALNKRCRCMGKYCKSHV